MKLATLLLPALGSLLAVALSAQNSKDSSKVLQEVVVQAFHGKADWKQIPASIAIIRKSDLRNSPLPNFLPVFNTVPGVRMEERSPGSYRLSIRGSLLRSPFGVRNIKVYWNGLPLTDGGGNTYLNLIDLSQITGAEILKGPVAAAYGAGTGGAVLLKTDPVENESAGHHFSVGLSGGSFGMFQQQTGWEYQSGSFSSTLNTVHIQADGYRQHSRMRRDALNWHASWQKKKQIWRVLAMYTDLFYQTPGGINEMQFTMNPQLARQPAGLLPGAVQQQTAIHNKTGYTGIHHQWNINEKNSIRSFVMGSITAFKNPFITNFEERAEDNAGAGIQWQYKWGNDDHQLQWNTGMEWQYQFAAIDNFGNRRGIKDTLQFSDRVHASQWFVFTQLQYRFHQKWMLQAGISSNEQSYRYKRLGTTPMDYTLKKIRSVITPRVALSYQLTPVITGYALAAKGFSAPTLAEFRPSDGNFYGDLNAETGWNFEMGWKGSLFKDQLQFDVSWYHFRLKNAIVRRNSVGGAEYFVNAGSTLQQGLEAMLKAKLIAGKTKGIKSLYLSSSFAYQPYRFENYRQGNTVFDGNPLTGVPRYTWVTGIQLETVGGWYLQAAINATAAIALNDANDASAKPYQLLQGRTGYRKKGFELFLSMDNGLNQVYSLGNDINAAGRRYYNTAAPRNFTFGMNFGLR
ncbi:MAG: TonB-dependent receptor [Chitinophagaceae bacterium]|nr:TonB-dependent receptor [Chitinophagaceae bacterium]